MCGKHQIMREVAENDKLCDSAPTAPKRRLGAVDAESHNLSFVNVASEKGS